MRGEKQEKKELMVREKKEEVRIGMKMMRGREKEDKRTAEGCTSRCRGVNRPSKISNLHITLKNKKNKKKIACEIKVV